MNGQFKFDESGKVSVVTTDAREREAPIQQYTLDQLAQDTENAAKWGIDNEVPETDPIDWQLDTNP